TANLAVARLRAPDLDADVVVVLVVGAVDDPLGAAEVPARSGVGRVIPFGNAWLAPAGYRTAARSVVVVGIAVMADSNRFGATPPSSVVQILCEVASALVRWCPRQDSNLRRVCSGQVETGSRRGTRPRRRSTQSRD